MDSHFIPDRLRSFCAILVLLTACGDMDSAPNSDDTTSSLTALSEPEATFPEPFSSIVGLRELSDGRVFVSDRLGQALLIVDLAAGTADTVGRIGGGPGEYSSPGALFPWRGDSTLLLDMGNTRYTPIGADGGFGISSPLMTNEGESMSLVMPEGTDSHGSIYYQARSFRMGAPGANEPPDSTRIVRWNPDTGRADTVAALIVPDRRIQRSGGNVMMAPIPFGPSDDWAVSWNGDVGVARGVGFRIEWSRMDGQRVIGPQIDYEPIVITQSDRDTWLEARANAAGGAMMITIDGGGGGGNVRAAPPPRGVAFAGPQVAEDDWPEVKPPFPPSAVSATPEGELWVQRHVSHQAPPTYEVYDGRGVLIRTVELPANSRVVGFGDGTLYVATTDEFDLQWLERYLR